MVQDKLVAAYVMAENWKDRTTNRKGNRDPMSMTAQDFAKLDIVEQANVMDDAYTTMYMTWPRVIHRGVPVEIENTPENEIPTPDQIRCTKVNSACFQWTNMGTAPH